MNYPIWDVPASGLLIAAVAVLHVFISHFAVGGGLFLVLLESRAYRTEDPALLQFVRAHTRFFVLLTLVLGAVTGVGIWFTISLVHPQATSTLIQIFVWVWAVEWVFFLTEITAAMVYYYGWDRLSRRNHLIVGWIYFGTAWLSLAAINGILSFMLTPGDWVVTGRVSDAFFNPTYWPSLLARTLLAVALAGLYAFFRVSFFEQTRVKEQVLRYAGLRWLVPSAALLPLALIWFLLSAAGTGIPVFEVLGGADNKLSSALTSIIDRSNTVGIPLAQQAVWVMTIASAVILVTALVAVFRRTIRPPVASVLLLLGLAAFAGGEWLREDLRKPYVLGRHMFVNGVRLPGLRPSHAQEDPLSVDALNRRGVLRTAIWTLMPPKAKAETLEGHEEGREMFRFLCSSCHTIDGHLGIKKLVQGQSVASLENLLGKLAEPVNLSSSVDGWADPKLQLRTWRGRRMPPFVGTEAEKRSLARYLASFSGVSQQSELAGEGQRIFEEKCLFCHGKDANWPIEQIAAGKTAVEFYDKIGRLPEINPIMPFFEGGDDQRLALSQYLAGLVKSADSKE
jgi:mono/diheme cytochrome c family protein